MTDIERLEDKIKELENRVILLESYRVVDNLPNVPWPFPSLEFMVSSCPKCGLALNKIMHYCCPNFDCPVGLGPTMY